MSTKTKSTSLQPPTGATVPGTAAYSGEPKHDETKAPSVKDIFSILQATKSSSDLDAEAMAYIDEINRIFRDSNEKITSIPLKTDKIEARAYVHEASRSAILVLFAETFQTLDKTPPPSTVPALMDALKVYDSSVSVIESIVVTRQDYTRAGKMAAFLSNAFQTISGSSYLTVESLKGVNLVAITAIERVRDFVRQVSPHSTAARDDIGVLICIEKPNEGKPNNFRKEVELIPLMAITGYTRVMNPQEAMTGTRFVAIPTITDIVSAIPDTALLSMALPFAADAFIMQRLWERPYAKFKTGCPNLGNLIKDPATKKPLFTDNPVVFRQFIDLHMTSPYLAIDIADGRARPVFIDSLINTDPDKPNFVLNKVGQFFHATFDFGANNGILKAFPNYTGTYVDKGEVKDTRYVDFLNLACKTTDHTQIEDLLLQPNQPQIRIERINSIYPENTKSLYTTFTVILDAQAVCQLNRALTDAHIGLRYDIPASTVIDFNQFALPNSTGNSFAGFNALNGFGNQTYYYPGIQNPYTFIR